MEEQINFTPKYFVGTDESYTALNNAISAARGYPDNVGTYRYAPEEPTRDIDGNAVMLITENVQEENAEALQGITLVEGYQPFVEENEEEE